MTVQDQIGSRWIYTQAQSVPQVFPHLISSPPSLPGAQIEDGALVR
jgi:hypothetical protein